MNPVYGPLPVNHKTTLIPQDELLALTDLVVEWRVHTMQTGCREPSCWFKFRVLDGWKIGRRYGMTDEEWRQVCWAADGRVDAWWDQAAAELE